MKINEFIKLNQLVLLGMVAISTTALNVSPIIGGILLLASGGVMLMPLYIKDEQKYDLLPLIKSEVNKLIESTQDSMKKAEQRKIENQQLAEEQRINDILAEFEENIALATANMPLESRESLLGQIAELAEGDSQLLYRALANKAVDQRELLIVLNNIPKEPRTEISGILDTLVPVVVTSNQGLEPARPLTAATVMPVFKMEKKGTWINWAIFISGLLVVLIVSSLIFGSQFSNAIEGGGGAILTLFIISSLINAIYYLPSLIYHASTGGKILMFIINSILGITVIGWIVLLVFALSRNSNEKRAQELMHYIKHK